MEYVVLFLVIAGTPVVPGLVAGAALQAALRALSPYARLRIAGALGAVGTVLWAIWVSDASRAANDDPLAVLTLLGGAVAFGVLPALLVFAFGRFSGARLVAASLLAVDAILIVASNLLFCLLGLASQDYIAFLTDDMLLALVAGWIFTASAIVALRAVRRMERVVASAPERQPIT